MFEGRLPAGRLSGCVAAVAAPGMGALRADRGPQAGNRANIGLALTCADTLSSGIGRNRWGTLLPDNPAVLPGVPDRYTAGPRRLPGLA